MSPPNRSLHGAITERDLKCFKYYDQLLPLLESLHADATDRDKAGNRQLFYDQYASLLLLAFFNPILTSLRGLQQVSELDKVQRLLGVGRVSLGALSEASTVFDPALLRAIVHELADRAVLAAPPPGQRSPSPQEREALAGLTAADGTLLAALPRMLWALWRDDQHHAAKLHLQLDVFQNVPLEATLTTGSGAGIAAETAQLQANLQAGRLYVMDRGYASFALFCAILDAGSSFVARVKDNTAFTVAHENPISTEAAAAGVVRDVVVAKLGTEHHKDFLHRPVRLVLVEFIKRDGTRTTLWLVTDRLDLPAELVALAYRYRWTIELFFRWFKCILGCRHLFAESANGVAIQCYCALIASLMIVLWTGLRPTKRTWEMLQLYLSGWATLDELERHLASRRRLASADLHAA